MESSPATLRRLAQNALLDAIASGRFKPITSGSAVSLHPNQALVEAAAAGDEEAVAIADNWRFRFAVRKLTAEQIEAINPHCTFTGRIGDLR